MRTNRAANQRALTVRTGLRTAWVRTNRARLKQWERVRTTCEPCEPEHPKTVATMVETIEPKLAMRGHDVEEFIGVVRRYGVGESTGALARIVSAANSAPEVGVAGISQACGTCLARVA